VDTRRGSLLVVIGVFVVALRPISVMATGPPTGWVARPPIHVANYPYPHRLAPLITNPSPVGYIPCEIGTAYYLNHVSGTGSGQLVAIVDAFDNPNATGDLATFDSTFGVAAPPSFTVVAPFGIGTTTATNLDGWRLEESLDADWVHSIAPGAALALVEAHSDVGSDLLNAVDYAVGTLHANVVSMSWGGSEFAGQTSFDSHFPNNSGIMFLASAGDSGSGAQWPSSSANVISVGGTNLSSIATGDAPSTTHTACSGTGTGTSSALETAWSGSGGGISAQVGIPSYQSSYSGPVHGAATINALTSGKRGTPDVSAVADPNTGVAVYDSNTFQTQTGWFQVGGTSLAAPVWAGLFALADQQRTTAGKSDLAIAAADATEPAYSVAPGSFIDITSGSNGACGTNCTAGAGYDLVTGVGSPAGTQLLKTSDSWSVTYNGNTANVNDTNVTTPTLPVPEALLSLLGLGIVVPLLVLRWRRPRRR
jgi:subtilase family serine protease